ncbi:MAG: protein arginine kinase [Caloramator sp.]|jgi:protein arginine kinase|uniref:protein arginine kinase n=1 Tax=Caloramator sp. TaxID=1871330 RepID=UPI001D990390|nr:protein arginine kinase [Caloramator sp.]MBZ4663779.1 protein arginine kinase [Caloramator sp.]
MAWFFSKSSDEGIVLTSRIRLARNIDGIPFPHLLDKENAKKVVDDVTSAILESNSVISNDFEVINLSDISLNEKMSMVEKHLISKDLINRSDISAVMINRDKNVSIMINEEDHIRLQVIYPGFKLKEAYELASKIDDLIEQRVNYAYDTKLGYLTSCPTNVGTGLRASVMLHLPALTITKNINNIINTINQVGLTIRGLYGEGSNALGNVYQISNQITLGLSEDEIINNLIAVTKKIVEKEKKAREMLLEKQSVELEDELYRSLGILKFARSISTQESLELISKVRMGVEMGIIKDVKVDSLNELFVNVQPATLQLLENRDLNPRDRDIVRAKLIREKLS